MSLQVEHAHKESHKQKLLIGSGYGTIDLAHHIGSRLIVAGQIAKQRAGDGHIKGGWHTLSGHIADNEKHLVAIYHKVVQVASHLAGRCHRGKNIYILALRKVFGNHAHLYVVGNGQLAQHVLLGGCGLLQILNILFQRNLHILKRVAQLQQFIFRLDLRQRRVEVSIGDAHG